MNKKAFTLLELIIVLALLAILASVAVAKFVDMSKKTLDVTEKTTIDALRSAILLYKAKYDVWPDGDESTWSPLELLENPPPRRVHTGTPDYMNGTEWVYGTWAAGGGRYFWRICCPHGSPETTVPGGYPGYCWHYMIDTGVDNWGTDIHTAGSVFMFANFVGHK